MAEAKTCGSPVLLWPFEEQPPDSGTDRAKEKGLAAMKGLDFNVEFWLPDLSSNQGATDCQSTVIVGL